MRSTAFALRRGRQRYREMSAYANDSRSRRLANYALTSRCTGAVDGARPTMLVSVSETPPARETAVARQLWGPTLLFLRQTCVPAAAWQTVCQECQAECR